MRLTLINGEQLMSVGSFLVEEFESLMRRIRAGWRVQHNDDGSHSDVTATSLIVRQGTPQEVADGRASGDVIADGVGEFGGSVTAQTDELTECEIGSLSSTGQGYNAAGGLAVKSNGGVRAWRWVARSAAPLHAFNLYDHTNVTLPSEAIGIEVSGTTYYFAPGVSATGVLGSNTVPVRRWLAWLSDSDSTNGYFERGRSARIGEWIDVAFAAGNFTGSGTLVITVAVGDQTVLRYTLVGKTMTIVITLDTISVSGVGAEILVAIPGGFTSAKFTGCAFGAIYDNSGTVRVPSFAYVTAGGTQIHISRMDSANLTASANLTYLYGQITFEIP